MKKLLLMMGLLLFSQQANAWSECTKTPKQVYTQYSNDMVYVCFNEPGCIYIKTGTNITSHDLKVLYAGAMTAIALGKKLRIRYPEDNVNCSASAGRNDTLGFWVTS